MVIPKAGKDDYNELSADRTVSLTSSIGKRFERITSQRLIAVLDSVNFDSDQFAYLKERSATHALLVLTESVKKGLITGERRRRIFISPIAKTITIQT